MEFEYLTYISIPLICNSANCGHCILKETLSFRSIHQAYIYNRSHFVGTLKTIIYVHLQ
ncbi:hypothetical protein Hanom_Chr01g00071141 [Helianthus anomalus]